MSKIKFIIPLNASMVVFVCGGYDELEGIYSNNTRVFFYPFAFIHPQTVLLLLLNTRLCRHKISIHSIDVKRFVFTHARVYGGE